MLESPGDLPSHLVGVELHVSENISNTVTLYDLLDDPVSIFVPADMNRMSITEEIVEVSQRFLIGPREEDRQVVGVQVAGGSPVSIALHQRMDPQRALRLSGAGEVVQLSVGVAGDIRQGGPPRGLLLQR